MRPFRQYRAGFAWTAAVAMATTTLFSPLASLAAETTNKVSLAQVMKRTVLVFPYATGFRMQRRTLHIAVAKTENFRPRTRRFHERVISRNTPVVVKANTLAAVVIQLLRTVRRTLGRAIPPIPQCDVEITLPIEHNARAEMHARRRFWLHLKQHFDVCHHR